MKKIKVLELFSGYGSQALALENLDIEFTSDISEIDKYAIDAYNQIHGQTKNYGDICKINEAELPEYDLVTYSSPCQDFSVAGKMKGGEKGSGTRSSLLWECERIIRAVKPKYLLMENVKNLVGKKFMPCFKAWLCTLEEIGYNNYWQVLNAKDYGIPQNRERVFVVSIRKDLNQTYMFPEPVPLTLKLKDLLEPEVDEKYYLPQGKVEKLCLNPDKEVRNTIRCGGGGSLDGKHTWDVVISKERFFKQAIETLEENECNPGDIVDAFNKRINRSGCSPTLTTRPEGFKTAILPVVHVPINTCADGSCQALTAHLHKETANDCTKFERHSPATGVLGIKANTKKGYNIAEEGDSINLEQPNSTTRRGRIGKGKAQTLTTSCNQGIVENMRIRKLTPRECWRLMGVRDEQFDRLHGISKTQLYKMAGNSIVVDVLMDIFKSLLISDKETKGQLYLL